MLQATVGRPDHTGAQWSRPRPQLGHGTQLRLAAVQRVAEESEELGRILRIEARPLKQAVGGSCGEASAPELDLIIIKDPGSASSCTIRASCSLHPTALIRAQPAAGALDMSSAATRCCTPSPSVARDLVHIQKVAVRTVLRCTYRRSQYERYSLAVTSDGKVGSSGVVLRALSGPGGDNVR